MGSQYLSRQKPLPVVKRVLLLATTVCVVFILTCHDALRFFILTCHDALRLPYLLLISGQRTR
eukprot:scaffold23122_cov94-Skeletonema_menzelii.AAC.1